MHVNIYHTVPGPTLTPVMLACTDFTTSVLGPGADHILPSATQPAELTHPEPRFISTSFLPPRPLLITPCTMGRLRRVRKAKARLERLCVRACVRARVCIPPSLSIS